MPLVGLGLSHELVVIDKKIKIANEELTELVAATGSRLQEHTGIGPSGAARLLGDISEVALSVGLGPVLMDPLVHVVGSPDFALCEVGDGFGEVSAASDLVDALPADSAQAEADLMGADETDPGCSHAPD